MAGILDEFLLIFKPTVQGTGFQQLNRQVKQTYDNLFSVKNLFKGFLGYDIYSGLKSFGRSLVDSSKELGAMTSRFYAITKSEKLANEELNWTFDLAKRTAMGLKATADSYSIFYSAVQKSVGTSGARQIFQDWTEVSRVLHLSEYQFERVTYALREMASKGAIYSQDLRMQIGTHVPNAMGLAEKAVNELGVTGSNWFDDFREQAKGNQQLINKFIVLFSKYAREMYASPEALANAMKKPDAQIQKLFNTWQEFKYAIVRGGFEKDLVKFLQLANALLEKVTKNASGIYKLVKTLIALFALTKGVKWLGAGAKWIGTFAKRVAVLTAEFGGLRLALSHIGKMFARTGLLRLIGALGGAGALTALFTTPPGWVILGLTAIVAGVLWFKHQFPNAWLAITNYISWLGSMLDRFIWTVNKWMGSKPDNPNMQNDNSGNAIRDKFKDIQQHGGMFGNDKYGDIENIAYLTNALRRAEQLTKNDHRITNFIARKNPVQQKFNIQVQMKIQEANNGEELMQWLNQNKPTFAQWWGGIFKK